MPRTQFIASISLISLASLALFVPIVWAQVRLFGQCGGVGYTGPTTCVSGLYCNHISDAYSACFPNNVPVTTII